LELVKSAKYNLILSDIKMPGMDGKEFYRKIEEIAPSLTGRLVFITGDVMGEDTRDFIRKTGVRYITKPFDAGRLRGVVNNMLGDMKE
jgi:CheY-like chemotaxis protein